MWCVSFRGKVIGIEGAVMLEGKMIKCIKERGGYKYLEILEADWVKHGESKEQIRKDYIRCRRNILRSKLNGGNIIRTINIGSVSNQILLEIGKTAKLLTL